ncbi:hypothetical protein B7H17_26320, partial [Pseudomonas putida]
MGPLMQSNGISILNEDGVIAACSFLEVGPCSRTDNYQRGRNYLEAACRTIVASKLGSVVAIPDEINRITRDKHTDRRIVDIRVNVVRQISLDGPREWAMGDYTKIYSDGSEELATFDEFREGVRNF